MHNHVIYNLAITAINTEISYIQLLQQISEIQS